MWENHRRYNLQGWLVRVSDCEELVGLLTGDDGVAPAKSISV
jgi:hypothetical protein